MRQKKKNKTKQRNKPTDPHVVPSMLHSSIVGLAYTFPYFMETYNLQRLTNATAIVTKEEKAKIGKA